jgi:hypothetical protein
MIVEVVRTISKKQCIHLQRTLYAIYEKAQSRENVGPNKHMILLQYRVSSIVKYIL